jgi:hypothetical protein
LSRAGPTTHDYPEGRRNNLPVEWQATGQLLERKPERIVVSHR